MIVEDVLEHWFRTAPPKVEVTVTDDVVTLAGILESPAHARLAVHLARQVAGVVDVVDRLTFRTATALPDRHVHGSSDGLRGTSSDTRWRAVQVSAPDCSMCPSPPWTSS